MIRELAARYLMLAQESPDAEAIVYQRGPMCGQTLSWGALAERSSDLLAEYRSAGVGEGLRVAVTLEDHLDMFPALLALWRCDATAIILDATWGQRIRGNVVTHAAPGFAIDLTQSAQITRLAGPDPAYPLPEGTALMGYTSGSTGDPKAVPFTHQAAALNAHAAACAYLQYHRQAIQRVGCVAKLSGLGTMCVIAFPAAFCDAPLVLLPEPSLDNVRRFWSQIEDQRIDVVTLFPSQVELINHLAGAPAPGTAPLCLVGTAPVTKRLKDQFRQTSGLPLITFFGIMEGGGLVMFSADDTIGVPYLHQARLADPDGAVVNGPGQGELELSGPMVFDGYYGNETATKDGFNGRWLRTGDIAERDNTGRYAIIGRRKHAVMKNGYAVYLNEVEEAALAVPGVIEAAAVPTETYGHEDIGLLVLLDDYMTTTVVQQAVTADMGRWRAPGKVVRVHQPFPRTSLKKLDRAAVREIWATQ